MKKIFEILIKFFKKIWNLFKKIYFFLKKEELHTTVIGFLLTGVLVTAVVFRLNSNFQKQESERQRQFEMFRFNLEKKDETITLVSSKIDSRHLASFRVLSNVGSQRTWDTYIESVEEWNIAQGQIRTKLATYYDWNFAAEIISESNDSSDIVPKTIHYKFVRLHNLLVSIRLGDKTKINEANKLLEEIQKQRDDLTTRMIEELKKGTFK